MGKDERERCITAACQAAKCDTEKSRRHFQLYVHEHWDPHPPADFIEWWEPERFDPILGSRGGHDEAWKAGPDPRSTDEQHPDMVWGGCKVITAWNTARNRQEFHDWKLSQQQFGAA